MCHVNESRTQNALQRVTDCPDRWVLLLRPPQHARVLLAQLAVLLQLLAPIEELEDEDKKVDDVQVELDRGHNIVIGPHPVVDHVRVCRGRGRAKVSTATHRRQIQPDTQAGMRVSRFGA